MTAGIFSNRIDEKKVRRVKHVHNVEVDSDDSVWLVTDNGREHLPGINTIVFASDRRSNRSVVEMAEARGVKTHIIGDCLRRGFRRQWDHLCQYRAGLRHRPPNLGHFS